MYSVQQLTNERQDMSEYAANPADPSYVSPPTSSEIDVGASPLDVLPAQWWNYYTQQLTQLNNVYLKFMKNVLAELGAVVTADGSASSTQLKDYLDTEFAKVSGAASSILTNSTPNAVAATASVGTATTAARADHVHSYTFSTTAPVADGTAAVGTATLPARADHVHPLNVSTTAPKAAGTAAVGTSTAYARADHVHPAQSVPAASTTTPSALGTAAVGTSTAYARADHVHPAQSVPAASTTAAGIVQLNSTTSSTSVTQAATASAVKAAYDLASTANSKAVPEATTSTIGGVRLSSSGWGLSSADGSVRTVTMVGATSNADGTPGLVPAPSADADTNRLLTAFGRWKSFASNSVPSSITTGDSWCGRDSEFSRADHQHSIPLSVLGRCPVVSSSTSYASIMVKF